MRKGYSLAVLLFLICSSIANAQIISTIAGCSGGDDTTNGIPALTAKLDNPWAIAVDDSGNIYISEPEMCVVRKIDVSGNITTVAGNRTAGYTGDNGPATAAQLNFPYGLAVDHAGNLYIADQQNSAVRMVSPAGIITTFAGVQWESGYTGDGGSASYATLDSPFDVTFDAAGNLYISDAFNEAIRRVSTGGVISTIINHISSFGCSVRGLGYTGDMTSPSNCSLSGIATDQSGNIFIADFWDNIIREVTPLYGMTTIAGSPIDTVAYYGDGGLAKNAALWGPKRITVDGSGNIVFSDLLNNRIRKIDASGIITTIAGNGSAGNSGDGGMATAAELSGPVGVVYDHRGNLYITDNGNGLVRKVSPGNVGVEQLFISNNFALLPDPNNGTFSAKGSLALTGNENVLLEVVDMAGKVVYKNTAIAKNGTLDTQISIDVSPGMYLLKMSSARSLCTRQFVIEK